MIVEEVRTKQRQQSARCEMGVTPETWLRCTTPVTRGTDNTEKWLVIDPLRTCEKLKETRLTVRSSLEGVSLKQSTREALRHFMAGRHRKEDIEALYLHADGGGARCIKGKNFPATWAISMISRAKDGTLAFYGFACGEVCTLPSSGSYVGADQGTSMTAECTAQLMAALCVIRKLCR